MASTATPYDLFQRREEPARDLARQASAVAGACHAMAVRFHRGGKLIVFGTGGASADAQHVSVEFVHPVIVGKRALPAISLTADVATVTGIAEHDGFDQVFARQIKALARPEDIAMGISADGNSPSVLAGLEAARDLGLLPDGLAMVDTGRGEEEEVSIALVDAAAGDRILVHAREAIAVVQS